MDSLGLIHQWRHTRFKISQPRPLLFKILSTEAYEFSSRNSKLLPQTKYDIFFIPEIQNELS